jgi:hypothetical protein
MKRKKKNEHPELEGWFLEGHVAVDSGQMMLCDPCYIKHDFASSRDVGVNYESACQATLADGRAGQLGNEHCQVLAFVSSSGWGDGVYPVYVKRFGDRVGGLLVEFIEEDSE